MSIGLGDKVKDSVTGFVGIVTSIAACLNGCDRILVQPKIDKKGAHPDSYWFDENQISVVKRKVVKAYERPKPTAKTAKRQRPGGWPTKGSF